MGRKKIMRRDYLEQVEIEINIIQWSMTIKIVDTELELYWTKSTKKWFIIYQTIKQFLTRVPRFVPDWLLIQGKGNKHPKTMETCYYLLAAAPVLSANSFKFAIYDERKAVSIQQFSSCRGVAGKAECHKRIGCNQWITNRRRGK